ncbi:hypothetical protein QUF72_00615 [Desulfobacterales bacterium HSG2]|nr:hypothetical protein [Desulfobacterales bacterium HSG2]MDM8548538.1 hypothetical protein [Desulfobacterales bacterium HSG2]
MFYTIIISLVIIVLGIIIIPPFIVIPIIARFKIRMPRDSGLLLMDTAYLPKYVAQLLSQVTYVLKSLGFEAVADVFEPEHEPAMSTTYFRLFVNQTEKDMAVTIISLGNSGQEKRVTNAYVEFCTHFSTDNKISTNNNGMPPVFKDVPESRIFRFPGEQDMGTLYNIHQQKVSEFIGEAENRLPREGGELDYLRDSLIREMDLQLKTGYLYFDESADAYRPTWKGAFLMMWKSAIGAVRMKYRQKKEARS